MSEQPIPPQETVPKREMTSVDVLDLQTKLEDLGISIWIDGGWGVDALLGEQTRTHGDLDIGIEWKDVPKLLELLTEQGYKEIKRDSEWNFVMADDKGHEIDVHAFVFDAGGNIEKGIMYPNGSLAGTGTIDGKAVKCIAPEFMVKFHSGYALRESDYKDVTALCDKFGIEYPDEYKHLKK